MCGKEFIETHGLPIIGSEIYVYDGDERIGGLDIVSAVSQLKERPSCVMLSLTGIKGTRFCWEGLLNQQAKLKRDPRIKNTWAHFENEREWPVGRWDVRRGKR